MKNIFILAFISIIITSTFSSELGLGVSGIDFSTFESSHFALYVSGNIQFSYKDADNSYRNPLSLNMDFGWFKFEKNNLRLRLMSGAFITQEFGYNKYVYNNNVSSVINYDIIAYGIDVLSLSLKLSISQRAGIFFYSNFLTINLDFFELAETEYKLGVWAGSNNLGIYIKF